MTRDRAALAALSLPVEQAAVALLGRLLALDGVVLRLSEVEAYGGQHDPASHAWRGRTAGNRVMFGAAGIAYVYRSYGIHWCLNVVTGTAGEGAAVLLRAGEVVSGLRAASARRPAAKRSAELARGPGRLTQALGVHGGHSGVDLLCPRSPLRLLPAPVGDAASHRVDSGPRVGVSRAADVPWRFWIRDDPTVSAYRRSPRAPASAS